MISPRNICKRSPDALIPVESIHRYSLDASLIVIRFFLFH